jgi:DeoR/GlpR family transcriptional regulator of sugar metabolism
LELLSHGYTNQREIAQLHNISELTISRDITHITKEKKQIPLEIERCHMALNLVLRKASEITNSPDAKISEKLQSLSVILTTYDKIADIVDNKS